METTNFSDIYKILLDRADLSLEEARNAANTCKVNRMIFQAEGDSLLNHLPLHRHVPLPGWKVRRMCTGGCRRPTMRYYGLYPHAGPLCRKCEKSRPEYHTIDYTTARRRFYLSKEDLEDVPAIMRYLSRDIRCRYFRPADLLAVALKKYGGQAGLCKRRELGLRRRAAALKGIETRRRRLQSACTMRELGSVTGLPLNVLPSFDRFNEG